MDWNIQAHMNGQIETEKEREKKYTHTHTHTENTHMQKALYNHYGSLDVSTIIYETVSWDEPWRYCLQIVMKTRKTLWLINTCNSINFKLWILTLVDHKTEYQPIIIWISSSMLPATCNVMTLTIFVIRTVYLLSLIDV